MLTSACPIVIAFPCHSLPAWFLEGFRAVRQPFSCAMIKEMVLNSFEQWRRQTYAPFLFRGNSARGCFGARFASLFAVGNVTTHPVFSCLWTPPLKLNVLKWQIRQMNLPASFWRIAGPSAGLPGLGIAFLYSSSWASRASLLSWTSLISSQSWNSRRTYQHNCSHFLNVLQLYGWQRDWGDSQPEKQNDASGRDLAKCKTIPTTTPHHEAKASSLQGERSRL